jgi:hypothetical protein
MITCKFSGDTVSHFDSFTHLFESNAVVFKYRQYEYASSLCFLLLFVLFRLCVVLLFVFARSEKMKQKYVANLNVLLFIVECN